MNVIPLRRPGHRRTARQLLAMILEHGHIEQQCPRTGRTILALELEPWELDLLTAFGAGAEDLEDGDDAEEDRDEV